MRPCPLGLVLFCALASPALAQRPPQNLTPEERTALLAKREATEKQLEDIAVIDRKVMVPMRDGKRMAADIYRPKDTSKKYPVIFSRTPYNFNFWDVKLGTYRDMTQELEAVKRGYVLVEMNERGHFFSEGDYDILGAPLSDADDQFTWMGSQPWSSGKVGLIGCSSTAEWQMAAASLGNKALTTIIPESFGAGVGKVGPYNEQGNWYRGGAVQMLFIDWLYSEQNQVRRSSRPTPRRPISLPPPSSSTSPPSSRPSTGPRPSNTSPKRTSSPKSAAPAVSSATPWSTPPAAT